MPLDEFLTTRDELHFLYQEFSAMQGFRLRSINLNWHGPTITLRIDLPSFPERAPQSWIDAGADTVQCQLRFLAVEDVRLSRWQPPTVADLAIPERLPQKRIRVDVRGSGVSLDFTGSTSVLVQHVSAFTRKPDGSDEGPHVFSSKIDAFRHHTVPAPSERVFHEGA